MNKILFFYVVAIVFISSCETKKETIVPANRVELLKGEGYVSASTSLNTNTEFDVKLWVYAHYSFNKIEVTSQIISPSVQEVVKQRTLEQSVDGVAFSTNYTALINNLDVTSQSNATQKFTFTVTDNKGRIFSESILITSANTD
ncbi:MAG: hypothetical protein ACKVOU_05985 [Cytophagales bacterium]